MGARTYDCVASALASSWPLNVRNFGRAILNSGVLPTWLGWIAYALALIALLPPLGFFALVGAGVWTLIVSVAMWRRLSGDTTASTEEAASTPA